MLRKEIQLPNSAWNHHQHDIAARYFHDSQS
jgi:hypothetical protein